MTIYFDFGKLNTRFFPILVFTICMLILVTNAMASDIHLAQDGDDSNDGASLNRAVATLKRAIELTTEAVNPEKRPIRILVQPGIYRGQGVLINGSTLPHELLVIGQGKDIRDFPVFISDGSAQTWLTLKASNGRTSGLAIQALEIRDYFTAISLEGNRDDSNAYNSGTIIRNNIFRNIGSISTNVESVSTAAIRFVNSKNNLVELNQFHSIRNKKGCGALHALYLAHFSSGSRIVNNTFDDACGSVIKLRDRSNNNIIENNKFTHIEKSPVIEEWFCDMSTRKDCTKKLGECPSTDNVQLGNTLSDSLQSKMLSIVGERNPRPWCTDDDYSRVRVHVGAE